MRPPPRGTGGSKFWPRHPASSVGWESLKANVRRKECRLGKPERLGAVKKMAAMQVKVQHRAQLAVAFLS